LGFFPALNFAGGFALLDDNVVLQPTGDIMDDAAKFERALMAVLYAVKRKNLDLDTVLGLVKKEVSSNNILLLQLPDDQSSVIHAVEGAILDILNPFNQPEGQAEQQAEPHVARVVASVSPSKGVNAGNMPCPDCKGKKVDEDGELCNLCNGTGVTTRY
jgi:hypothetical protein